MPKQVIINMGEQYPFGECDESDEQSVRVVVRKSIQLGGPQKYRAMQKINFFKKLNHNCIIKIEQLLEDDRTVHLLYEYVPIRMQTWVSNINEKFLQSFCKQLIEFGDYLAKCYIEIELKIDCVGMDQNYRPKYFLDYDLSIDQAKDKNSLKFKYQQQVLTLFKPYIQSRFTLKSFLNVQQNYERDQQDNYSNKQGNAGYAKNYGYNNNKTDKYEQQSSVSSIRLQQKANVLKLRKNESISVCSNNYQMVPFEKNRKQSILSSVSNIKINRLGRRIYDIKNKLRSVYSPESMGLRHEERSIEKKDNSIAFNFDSTSRIVTTNKMDSASFCSNIMRDLQQQETIFQRFEKSLVKQLGRGVPLKKNERLKAKQYEQMKQLDDVCIQDILSVLQQQSKPISHSKSNLMMAYEPSHSHKPSMITYEYPKEKVIVGVPQSTKQIDSCKLDKGNTLQLQNRVKNAINKSKNLINKFKNER